MITSQFETARDYILGVGTVSTVYDPAGVFPAMVSDEHFQLKGDLHMVAITLLEVNGYPAWTETGGIVAVRDVSLEDHRVVLEYSLTTIGKHDKLLIVEGELKRKRGNDDAFVLHINRVLRICEIEFDEFPQYKIVEG